MRPILQIDEAALTERVPPLLLTACAISNDAALLADLALKGSDARFTADGLHLAVETVEEFLQRSPEDHPIALLVDVDSVPDWEDRFGTVMRSPTYVVLVRSREMVNRYDEQFGTVVSARSVKDALACVRMHAFRKNSRPMVRVSQVMKVEKPTDKFDKLNEK